MAPFLFLPLDLPPSIRRWHHLPTLPSRVPTHPTHQVFGADAGLHELDMGTVDGQLVLRAGDVVDVRTGAVVRYEELAHCFREKGAGLGVGGGCGLWVVGFGLEMGFW